MPLVSNSSTTVPTVTTPTTTTIKAVLFDLDGTLLDTESLSDKALLHALFPNRKQPSSDLELLPWELKKQILGLRGAEWAPIVLSYYNKQQHAHQESLALTEEALWNAWEVNLNNYCAEVQECPGAVRLVEQLHALQPRVPMAIATSSRRDNVAKKRLRHEQSIFSKMQTIVTGEDVANGKPAPDIYLEAARRLGVHPADCLVVEDALSGVRAGKAAGCHVVAVPDIRFSREERALFEKEADVVLDSLLHFDGEMFGLQLQMELAGSQK